MTTLVQPRRLQPISYTPVFRGVWLLICALCVATYAMAVRPRIDQLRAVGGEAIYQLHAEEAALLADYGVSIDSYAAYMLFFEGVQVAVFFGVSLWLFLRHANDPVAMLTSLTLLVAGVIAPATTLALIRDDQTPLVLAVLQTARYLLTVLFVYVFPDGRFVPPWTRWLALAWVIGIVALPVIAADPEAWPQFLQGAAAIVWLGPGLAAQIYRYARVSTPEQKQQTRWFVFGFSVVMINAVVRVILGVIFPQTGEPGAVRLLFVTLISAPILDTLLWVILPIATGISVARYYLYRLNLVINRSLVYGLIVAGLGFAFFLGFFLIQGALQLVGGSPSLALVIATAITVALFNPARRRVQHFVDRRVFHLRADLNQMRQQRDQVNASGRSGHLTGVTLGAYEVRDLIGQGGMGQVYRAHHTALKRTVAIKVLSESAIFEQEFRVRFEREARIIAGLRHPNIVELYDYGVNDTLYFMVMEFINGEDLSARLRAEGPLTVEQAVAVVRGIASALDHAHAQGLVHRDVKPANVMLRRPDDMPVLMDFGIARAQDTSSGLTQTGLIGTLDYAAPEQITNSRTVDHRCDVYALGAMTYQMLTGEPPFHGGLAQVLFAHLQQPPPDAAIKAPHVPAFLAQAIQRAMAKNPDDRFQSAGDFAAALG